MSPLSLLRMIGSYFELLRVSTFLDNMLDVPKEQWGAFNGTSIPIPNPLPSIHSLVNSSV